MEGAQHNEQSPVESRDLSALMIFNRSSHFAYIYQKTEKLVTAVYMITNFIKDNEPLKWRIRENALELMSLNIAFNTVSLSERRGLLVEYQALSLEIVSLSSVAQHAGLISEMNFRILSREFNNLVSIIEKDENKKANEETVILDPHFFDAPLPTRPKPIAPSLGEVRPAPEAASPERNVLYKGQTAAIPAIDMSQALRKPEYLPLKEIKDKPAKTMDSKDGRQATIIKLLSKKSGLNIKDFSQSIKGCSEKTIQRELLAMVAAGVLKKEGERRWSTYSLAK